jgi:hypothetical protein
MREMYIVMLTSGQMGLTEVDEDTLPEVLTEIERLHDAGEMTDEAYNNILKTK